MCSKKTNLSLYYCDSYTPPSTPSSTYSQPQPDVAQFLELLKAVHALQIVTASTTLEEDTETVEAKETDKDEIPLQTYKSVDEIWDTLFYKYKIKESNADSSDDDLAGHPFIVRRKFDRKNVQFDVYVDIKSSALRDTLRDVLKNVKAISLREATPTVEANILYNFLQTIEAYKLAFPNTETKDVDQLAHLDILIGFLKSYYRETSASLLPLLDNGEITYDLLWALFRPNTLVYTTCIGSEKSRCVRFESGEYRIGEDGEMFFQLECRYLDYDGKRLGEATIFVEIPKFRGVRNITELTAFPIRYHEEEDRLREEVLACGRKFVLLSSVHHRHFSGQAFYVLKGRITRFTVRSRIMIDAKAFKEANPNYKRPRIFHTFDEESRDGSKMPNISDDQLLVCSPTAPGFSLENKLWAEFPIADIREIPWKASPYRELMLKQDQKDILLALSHSHIVSGSTNQFDDFVDGKGQGLVILLHGEPGLGKTLTAEAMSENLGRPLYSISAGEIGHDAAKLEEQLSQIFCLAKKWNAILLLDEADVFLESLNIIKASSSLRQIGMRNIDNAILSRIHYAIKYEDLSISAKRHIWDSHLKRARTSRGDPEIAPKEFKRLLERKFNGRQIKNIVRTAHALAEEEGKCLSHEHLQQSITAGDDFDFDFQGVGKIENLNSYT